MQPRVAGYPRTTNSSHSLPVFTNQIRDLKVKVTAPNQVWVVGLTYLRTEEAFVYLALITDKNSRKIVGYHCVDTLEAEGCLQVLEMALASLPAKARPIHHLDKDTQDCCHAYVERLQEAGLVISMTETNIVPRTRWLNE